jgi:hypothetical protein
MTEPTARPEPPDDEPLARPFRATPGTRPGRSKDVREYPLGDEVLLFADGRQVVHALNTSAWAVWDLCDGSRTIRDIVRELAELVGRDPDSLEPEVVRTVEELGGLGLLEGEEERGP